MSDSPRNKSRAEKIEQEAAAWVLRCDRGLAPAEQDDFSQWLASDPQHGVQFARHRKHWNRLDELVQWCPEHSAPPNPDLLAPDLRDRVRRFVPLALSVAAAAAAILAMFLPGRDASIPEPHPPEIIALSAEVERVLPDGSVIELNRGAVVAAHYTAGERRIRLENGEAHFIVAKDNTRPFIVTARGIDVQAVGTAFNVRVDSAVVEVLVTEGHVQVNAAAASVRDLKARRERPGEPPLVPILGARQRAVVSLLAKAEPPQIATLTAVEIERVLAWQHRLLNFTSAPLSEIVAEFNRRNRVQLVLLDAELASIRISATFRSDNTDGFVHLLEAGFGVKTERRGESEILLRRIAAERLH
ncbi:MAG: FecR domain-containing protein [Verrucomicrobia bacterium]|nr:FecR domain-containing protein [Verrucomicrobiota bacterium]